jgi:hypothetical protein
MFSFLLGHSQDTIRLKNGLVLHGLITEVNSKEIKFRVDGGSVTLDQVISYQKNGNSVAVQNPATQPNTNKPITQPDCERKNVGDIEFVNRTGKSITMFVFAIAAPPHLYYWREDKNNPIVAEIEIPANSSKTAYELTSGVHYIKYTFETDTGLSDSSGQIRITKCGTGTFEVK